MEIRPLSAHARMGIWRMDETPDALLCAYPHLKAIPTTYRNVVRQREFLSVRALLCEMTGDSRLTITHEANGRPIVEGYSVSISHTRGYAVLVLADSDERVGVDVEQRSARVERISDRFISPEESAPTLEEKLLLWSAKETVYKLCWTDVLGFFDMQALAVGPSSLVVLNKKHGQELTVHYEFSDDYVLTWAIQSDSSPQPCTNPSF